MIEYKKIIELISKYVPTPQSIELNKWVDSLRRENQELREEINIFRNRIEDLSAPSGISSPAPSCPNCSTSGKDFYMSPIPEDFIEIQNATHECTKCGYKTTIKKSWEEANLIVIVWFDSKDRRIIRNGFIL